MQPIIWLMIFLVFLTGCAVQESSNLFEIQEEACNAADDAGTCDTRLIELGIVMPEECCQELGRCCQ